MPSAAELKSHATSNVDFYDLLSLTPTFTQKDLDRAWRRTALKYHPDKIRADSAISATEAAERFHLASIAYEIFSDPSVRSLYDNAREARTRRKAAESQFEDKRRRMKEDLEDKERRGVKRSSGEAGFWQSGSEENEEERLEREARRLAEDGRRRRKEMEETLRAEINRDNKETDQQQEQQKDRTNVQEWPTRSQGGVSREDPNASIVAGVPELQRTVKSRFDRSSNSFGATLDSSGLRSLFQAFGPVENAFLLKDKKAKRDHSLSVNGLNSATPDRTKKKDRKLFGTGVVVFRSVVGAHAAVEKWRGLQKKTQGTEANHVTKQEDDPWSTFEEVSWAEGIEPRWISETNIGSQPESRTSTSEVTKDPSTPKRFPLASKSATLSSAPTTPQRTPASNFQEKILSATPSNPLRKVPSFASFSSAASTPRSASSPFVSVTGSPSLEELTMIKLRNAEKRRQEAQRVQKEAELEQQ